MKTIKQIADEIGISKQRVYRYIQKNHINEAHRDAGVMYFGDAVKIAVVRHFYTENHIGDVHQSASLDVVIDVLHKQLEMMDRQLITKDEQLERLDKRLAETTAALQAAQMLHADTKKLLPKRKLRLIEPPDPSSMPPMGGLKKFCLKIFTWKKM